jgi:uncharacterized delta-60 repeat protein
MTAGDPDPYFGTAGVATATVGGGHARGQAVAVQPDGGIVAGVGPAFGLLRFLPGGAVDYGFGDGGLASAEARGLADLALASDGRIWAVGYRMVEGARQTALARFSAAGGLEGVSAGAGGVGRALAALPGGGVVVASDSGSGSVAVTRHAPDGSTSGAATLVELPGDAVVAGDVAANGSGQVAVAGTAVAGGASRPFVARLRTDGAIDGVSVGATGLDGAQGVAVALAEDGSAIVAGNGRSRLRSVLFALRFGPDGAQDPAFGAGGVAILPAGGADAYAGAVALDPGGGIVLAGSAPDGFDVRPVMVRLGPDGGIDPAFAPGAPRALGPPSMRVDALAVDADGRLVAAGSAFVGDRQVLAVARHLGG